MERASAVGRCLAALLVALACPVAVASEEPETEHEGRHPKTVLVLSGGGARGMAHIGVLEVLEELRVPFDAIVGTSMGAVVGGLYASGVSPEDMRVRLGEIDWTDAFNDQPKRRLQPFRRKEEERVPFFHIESGFNKDGFQFPAGLVAGQKLNFYLRTMLIHASAVRSFDDLPIPFRAVTTDLDSGEMYVIDHGDLPKAIRASMAFPVMFTPVEYDGRLLVDGGVVRNLAIDVALAMGADVIIAVDVGSVMGGMDKSATPSAFGVLRRVQSIQSKTVRSEQLELIREQDVMIRPALDGVVTFIDFEDVAPAVRLGREAAYESKDRLERLAVPEDEYRAFLTRHRAGAKPEAIPIGRIEIEGVDRVPPERILRRIETRPGQQLDLAVLRTDLRRIFMIGEFITVEFNLEPIDDGSYLLRIEVEEKYWGPWYTKAGLALDSNFEGGGEFEVNLLLRRAEVNKLGAEWRTLVSFGDFEAVVTDFYQPLGQAGHWFFDPIASYIVDNDEQVLFQGTALTIDSKRWEIGVDFGRALGQWGQLRIGPVVGHSNNTPVVSGVDSLDEDIGALRFRFPFDTLDNAYFPRSGAEFVLEQLVSRTDLGAERDYERLSFRGVTAGSGGPNTMLARLRFGTDYDSELPFYDDFELGGFLDLSGLQRGELRGSKLGLLVLAYLRRLNQSPGLFGTHYYLGASVEAGNAWAAGEPVSFNDLRPAGSVFVGADTFFGPAYLAYGQSSGTTGTFYFLLGRPF